MNIQEKRLEFLIDTVNYYSEDVNRRATDEFGNCQYIDDVTKKRCAIGRILDLNIVDRNELFGSVIHERVSKYLPKEYRELGLDFLWNIQRLHDNNLNWNDNGLSDFGEWQVENIKNLYC